MAKSFLGLVTVDEIRGSLGLDAKDISDAIITSQAPEKDLQADLLTWVSTYQTVISEGAATTPTSAQTLKYLKLQNYSKYFIAAIFASSGMVSILQSKSDGKNQGTRFSNVTLKELQLDLEAKAASAKSELESLMDPEQLATYTQFSRVVSTYDPVTNTGS
tara:strand:+ start:146 stop:628 length:483 start_codon:yes stop_codon:yes gene_type:complete